MHLWLERSITVEKVDKKTMYQNPKTKGALILSQSGGTHLITLLNKLMPLLKMKGDGGIDVHVSESDVLIRHKADATLHDAQDQLEQFPSGGTGGGQLTPIVDDEGNFLTDEDGNQTARANPIYDGAGAREDYRITGPVTGVDEDGKPVVEGLDKNIDGTPYNPANPGNDISVEVGIGVSSANLEDLETATGSKFGRSFGYGLIELYDRANVTGIAPVPGNEFEPSELTESTSWDGSGTPPTSEYGTWEKVEYEDEADIPRFMLLRDDRGSNIEVKRVGELDYLFSAQNYGSLKLYNLTYRLELEYVDTNDTLKSTYVDLVTGGSVNSEEDRTITLPTDLKTVFRFFRVDWRNFPVELVEGEYPDFTATPIYTLGSTRISYVLNSDYRASKVDWENDFVSDGSIEVFATNEGVAVQGTTGIYSGDLEGRFNRFSTTYDTEGGSADLSLDMEIDVLKGINVMIDCDVMFYADGIKVIENRCQFDPNKTTIEKVNETLATGIGDNLNMISVQPLTKSTGAMNVDGGWVYSFTYTNSRKVSSELISKIQNRVPSAYPVVNLTEYGRTLICGSMLSANRGAQSEALTKTVNQNLLDIEANDPATSFTAVGYELLSGVPYIEKAELTFRATGKQRIEFKVVGRRNAKTDIKTEYGNAGNYEKPDPLGEVLSIHPVTFLFNTDGYTDTYGIPYAEDGISYFLEHVKVYDNPA